MAPYTAEYDHIAQQMTVTNNGTKEKVSFHVPPEQLAQAWTGRYHHWLDQMFRTYTESASGSYEDIVFGKVKDASK